MTELQKLISRGRVKMRIETQGRKLPIPNYGKYRVITDDGVFIVLLSVRLSDYNGIESATIGEDSVNVNSD